MSDQDKGELIADSLDITQSVSCKSEVSYNGQILKKWVLFEKHIEKANRVLSDSSTEENSCLFLLDSKHCYQPIFQKKFSN